VTEEREGRKKETNTEKKKEKSKKRVSHINTESYLRIAHQANNSYVYTPNITLQVLTFNNVQNIYLLSIHPPVVKSFRVWNSGLEPFLGIQAVETSV
jgi:hypothetical protein